MTGYQCRTLRTNRNLPLKPFGTVADVPFWKIAAWELGNARLMDEELSRLESVLAAVERIQRAIYPAKLDCSDGTALQAAVLAYREGRFGDIERMAVQPQANPIPITF